MELASFAVVPLGPALKDPFEQAQIDGANRLPVFWYVTIPPLKPAILATVLIRVMDALRTGDEM